MGACEHCEYMEAPRTHEPCRSCIAGGEDLGFTPIVSDPVNHPAHYTDHPSGVECIQVTEHMGFCVGNAVKYLWRAGKKGPALEDLKKAAWYINREIERIEKNG